MTAACRAPYPLPSGIGNLGGTGGLRYMVAPTLIDLKRSEPPRRQRKFCGTGANYDLIKAELAQFRLSHNTANPTPRPTAWWASSTRPSGSGRRAPASRAWRWSTRRRRGRSPSPGEHGQLIGLELAHTLGLTPPNRESPFDGAHSQNVTAENPSLNRRYNVVQRSFITTDRSLMKPSATSPSPDNVNTLLEVPDYAFLLCVLRRNADLRVPDLRPGHRQRERAGRRNALVRHVGLDDRRRRHSARRAPELPPERASSSRTSRRRSRRRSRSLRASTASSSASSGGAILSNLGVPVTFEHSEHGGARSTQTALRALLVRAALRDDRESHRALEGRTRARPARCCSTRGTEPTPPQVTGLIGRQRPDRAVRAAVAKISQAATSRDVQRHEHERLRHRLAPAGDSRCERERRAPTRSTFYNPATGPQTIRRRRALPTITDPVTIDGMTQPGFSGAPIIELVGRERARRRRRPPYHRRREHRPRARHQPFRQ